MTINDKTAPQERYGQNGHEGHPITFNYLLRDIVKKPIAVNAV